jgi:DNA-binding transcriptional LysR family regulator
LKSAVIKQRPKPPTVHLPGLLAFASVARHLNFGRAAAEFEVTPTAMSKTIKQLEAQLQVRLFNRTTRSVGLTEAGMQLFATLAPALEEIKNSVQRIGDSAGRPSGTLRINTSFVAFAVLIEPHLPQFLKNYPDITLDICVDNGLSDIVASGFDAGIRLGHALQRDMIAVPLGPIQRLIVVGSPTYLAAHAGPKTPADLLQHDCVRQRLPSSARLLDWEFRVGSKITVTDVSGRLIFDEMRLVLAAVRDGCGLGYVFEQFATRELQSGAVVKLLDKYCPPLETFYIYYSNRGQMAGKLRVFIDFIQAANWQTPK